MKRKTSNVVAPDGYINAVPKKGSAKNEWNMGEVKKLKKKLNSPEILLQRIQQLEARVADLEARVLPQQIPWHEQPALPPWQQPRTWPVTTPCAPEDWTYPRVTWNGKDPRFPASSRTQPPWPHDHYGNPIPYC